jgi:predicted ATPase/DNA-binding SARP family transcriptional activator
LAGDNNVVRVALLGPFEVQNDAGGCLLVAGTRLRSLIARLALAGGRPVSTSALSEAVWGGDPPGDVPNALQTLVSRARRALGSAAAVEQSAAGYRLTVTPEDVDALRFERLVAAGDVEEALGLWRGPALEDVGEFAAPYALRLTGLRLDATVDWLALELGAGRAAAHVAELEVLAVRDPLNEKVTALLMRALATTGRQAKALAAYESLRTRLADELGIDPGEQVKAVHLEVLRGKVEAASAAGNGVREGRRANLRAQLTSFVGREDEVNRVGTALASYRLVTLVGPGGAGKTRLATEVAAQIAAGGADALRAGARPGAADSAAAELAPDGVWMAELASVTDAADVPQAVLGSVGLREARIMLDGTQRVTTRDAQTRLLDGLANSRALLVLDNCEHLIDACAHLADTLLAHSPGLRIVATSREPLGIVGESLLSVPPLETDPAVRLFADRAAAVRPGFALDEKTLPLAADIVRRLDGLPLAIELAAARLRTLPLAEITRRLDDRFRLLTGGSRTALPRHRTLRAVVEWSWDLLIPAERLLAERFSVFPAGATPEAVASVCGAQGDTDDVVSSLVDKSLLQPVDDGRRLRMLETIREYGTEKLAGRGEVGEVRRRHAEYYSDLMKEAAPHFLTRDQLTWLKAAEADRDNIRAALHYWCDTQDAARAIALAVTLSGLAFLLGNHGDIAELIRQAVAVPGEADPDLRTMADTLHAITVTIEAYEAGPMDEHRFPGLADRVEALNFDRYPLAGVLRPAYAMFIQDIERARRYVEEAKASRDDWVVAGTWLVSAVLAENNGDMDALRSAAAQAVERFRAIGERWGLSSALGLVAGIRVLDGDLDGAAAAYAESSRLLQEMGSRDDQSQRPLQLANIAARRGDLAAAREFYQTALAAAAESDPSGMDASRVSAGYAMFEITAGNVESARSLATTAEQGVARFGPAHPARRHLAALVAASGLMIALADADLPLARERAATMYREGVATQGMPLLAFIAGALAHLAHALGRPERAAEMLGACAAVRGGEDPTDLLVTRLEAPLRKALGADAYDRAYAAGTALSRAEALALLDPAAL